MRVGICSENGCDRVVKAKGLCSTHHQRWYRAKINPNSLPLKRKRVPCVIVGCGRLTAAHEHYCRNHLRKLLLYGDPLGGRKVIDRCTVEGCNKRHRARGLCGNHYSIARKLETSTLSFVIDKLDEQIQDAEENEHKHRKDAFIHFKQYLTSVAEKMALTN